jgi:hypothetical protein
MLKHSNANEQVESLECYIMPALGKELNPEDTSIKVQHCKKQTPYIPKSVD